MRVEIEVNLKVQLILLVLDRECGNFSKKINSVEI